MELILKYVVETIMIKGYIMFHDVCNTRQLARAP